MQPLNLTRSTWHLLLAVLLVFLAACDSAPAASPAAASALPDTPTRAPTTTLTATPAAVAGYPVEGVTPSPRPYPAETAPPTAVSPPPTAVPVPADGEAASFLPLILNPPAPTAVPTQTAVPPSPTPTPIPTADFAAARADLQSRGEELAYAKIGFHVGVGGNTAGLEQWMRLLDAAGVPFFLKSVDNAQPILFAQELMRNSGVPHVLVYRKAAGDDYDWDVPNYNLPPAQAADIHWQRHVAEFPPELDPTLVWLETINEVDKNQAEWLGQFALRTAELAQRDGFRWAAFGWASGEPEPSQWETPSMLQFLRLAGNNPDRLAIALHEYSYTLDDIADQYPYKVGRFQELLRIVDKHGIPRPTILITEWGWTYQEVPPPRQAMEDIAWAARLYGRYPEIKGAAIWFLGSGWAKIADDAQRLIYPVTVYSLQSYFGRPPQPVPVQPEAFAP